MIHIFLTSVAWVARPYEDQRVETTWKYVCHSYAFRTRVCAAGRSWKLEGIFINERPLLLAQKSTQISIRFHTFIEGRHIPTSSFSRSQEACKVGKFFVLRHKVLEWSHYRIKGFSVATDVAQL
jgi:hypothetical protein